MKKTINILIIITCIFLLSGCNTNETEGVKYDIAIEIEKYGTIYAELDTKYAPITVNNFIKLVKDGFYDGLTFHRIINNFMIQGGDPLGTGYGGSKNTIKGEFSRNGVTNNLKHTRGVLSMARSPQSFDSASSQFFIVQTDSPSLDGLYASFGIVTEGIEIVDEICNKTITEDENGTVKKENQPIIKSIKIIKQKN